MGWRPSLALQVLLTEADRWQLSHTHPTFVAMYYRTATALLDPSKCEITFAYGIRRPSA